MILPAGWQARVQALCRKPVWLVAAGVLGAVLIWLFVFAAPGASQTEGELSGRYAFEVLAKLAVVIGLAYGGLYLLRRTTLGKGGGARRGLALEESVRLSPRQAVHILRAGERRLLIGATDQSVSILAELEAQAVAQAAPPEPFADTLAAWLRRDPAPRRTISGGVEQPSVEHAA